MWYLACRPNREVFGMSSMILRASVVIMLIGAVLQAIIRPSTTSMAILVGAEGIELEQEMVPDHTFMNQVAGLTLGLDISIGVSRKTLTVKGTSLGVLSEMPLLSLFDSIRLSRIIVALPMGSLSAATTITLTS